ncbi:putative virion-associated membrane protein [Moumouvirus australiensis]|uniref:Putative virion-associated membrane protein n=1 Tax=Moumouvirus australiensis TaxID=2109587 RepID=A0A2P1EKW1_9VIRU|nr:putative virion-associated membrane protein [Moumouvirus australiensis]AVL94529.1 putative virion-associated membrane protein [Moumouvirus australiensis]
MQQQPVRWNDIVFVCFPITDGGAMIMTDIGYSDDGYNRPIGGRGTIQNGDPYRIEIPAGYNYSNPDVENGNLIRLVRVNDSRNGCWYNGSGDGWLEIRDYVGPDWRADWIVQIIASTGNVLTYGHHFRLLNRAQTENPTFVSPSTFASLALWGGNNTNNSVLMLLPGPLENAKLQCCRDNPIFTQPDYCGEFRGTTCSGQCDDILTTYCAQVTTTDPKCGCLLPASFYYGTSGMIGPPECIDSRCVGTDAYRKSTQCKPNCDIIDCNININDFNGTNVDKIIYYQKCGNQPTPSGPPGPTPSGPPGTTPSGPPGTTPNGPTPNTSGSSRLLWIIIISIVVIIILALLIYLGYKLVK